MRKKQKLLPSISEVLFLVLIVRIASVFGKSIRFHFHLKFHSPSILTNCIISRESSEVHASDWLIKQSAAFYELHSLFRLTTLHSFDLCVCVLHDAVYCLHAQYIFEYFGI